MSSSDEHDVPESPEQSASACWQDLFGLDVPPVTTEHDNAAAIFPEITVEESAVSGPSEGGIVEAAADGLTSDRDSERRESWRRHTTYTLEKADGLLGALRALPPKDPSQRRLDKQAVIRHLVDEITALQKGGYTLEEIAAALTDQGLGITCPTLKNYLQRIRRASAEAARKGRSRAELPLVLRGRIRG
jgi:hypothetical protein